MSCVLSRDLNNGEWVLWNMTPQEYVREFHPTGRLRPPDKLPISLDSRAVYVTVYVIEEPYQGTGATRGVVPVLRIVEIP